MAQSTLLPRQQQPRRARAAPPGSPAKKARRHVLGQLLGGCAVIGGLCFLLPASRESLCWSASSGAAAAGNKRRELLAAAGVATLLSAAPENSHAFANSVTKIKRAMNDAKKPGAKQADLGLRERLYLSQAGIRSQEELMALNEVEDLEKGILKECDNYPHCFSTTYTEGIDTGIHDLQPWRFSGKDPETAFKEVMAVVNAYVPGQNDIDGGGWKIFEERPTYVYVQYESLKRGHRDDVEFAIKPGTPTSAKEGELLIRSSSRLGNWDYGVNAARLNRIAADLAEKGGWQTTQITAKSHPRYWSQNCPAGDMRKAPFVTREKFEDECKKWGDTGQDDPGRIDQMFMG